mmetsp:Transcript_33183/g.56391  ORF Transcript_33183/g.56391 Transcript_33183/m.56391 type:complete len:242 (-) Transcript_33183:957-1682(-)|eukprot:CAMPEP_0183717548 /NCGR_PEP_ID=MMETSP0737-20130205/11139_1 /TAXON_ID=385413 /ORGANISM="Thalassiosira miniscula, Strain CCMP1093" /LENGTH=241 /DNA_ID=CAMNT_0025947017 /DNA_START=48 /DNA_END=773 /DNA_ORIENTATION=-
MPTKPSLTLLALCFCYLVTFVKGACETENDLDFESCDLKDLKDDVLKDICNRIGLDMEGHVLPYLFDDEEGENSDQEGEEKSDELKAEKSEDDGDTTTRTYTHENYVKGAEECLMIEDEMNRLQEEDADYLEQLERDALFEDPEIVAEVIADVLKQDELLLNEMATKLKKDAPEAVKEMEGMLGEGEKLEDRPDVVGFIVAKLLSEDEDLEILGELDEMLAELVDDWTYEDSGDVGGGDEL